MVLSAAGARNRGITKEKGLRQALKPGAGLNRFRYYEAFFLIRIFLSAFTTSGVAASKLFLMIERI